MAHDFDSIVYHGSITFVPRITIAYPAYMSAIRHFRAYANLADETDKDLEKKMNWNNTQTYILPVKNEYCINKLVKNLPRIYQDEVHGDAKVIKVEIFDPKTHKLIATSNAA